MLLVLQRTVGAGWRQQHVAGRRAAAAQGGRAAPAPAPRRALSAASTAPLPPAAPASRCTPPSPGPPSCRRFGWTAKNEISNGRWVMFGLLVGMLTEYATGVDFINQIKLMVTYLGIADLE